MTEPIRQSAKIYQFPLGGRRTAAAREDSAPVLDPRLQRAAGISFGAWYHEAAMQEAPHARER